MMRISRQRRQMREVELPKPFKKKIRTQKPEQTVLAAAKLIAMRQLSDAKISQRLSRQGMRISYKTVGRIRQAMALPPTNRPNPKAIEAVKRLLKQGLSNTAISRALRSNGFSVSQAMVSKIRASMGLPNPFSKHASHQKRKAREMAEKLFADESLSNEKIARILAKHGWPVSAKAVGFLRRTRKK